jgi:PAS domain-containing protein
MASSVTHSGLPEQAPDLRLVIDSAPALIHTALPDGYLDFFNETWLKYVGLSLQDLQGWRWTVVIHPEDVDGILAKWRSSLATGEIFLHASSDLSPHRRQIALRCLRAPITSIYSEARALCDLGQNT